MTDTDHQYVLTQTYLGDLQGSLDDPHTLEIYSAESFPLDRARMRKTPISLKGPPPNLLGEAGGRPGPKDDSRHAKLVHKYLGELPELQAADPRLWACLTHDQFFPYTRERWGLDGNLPNKIRARWFMRGGRQGLLGNSVARLWWGAHLTYAPWDRDPELKPLRRLHADEYIYTRWLFDNQNMFQSLVARRFGSSLRVRICMLEAFERLAKGFTNRSALSEHVARHVNLICSYRVLSALGFDELMSVMESQVRRGMKSISEAPGT